MGDRVILHSDINCCYASIEHLHHPELAGKPLAVGGDPEARHGIVLTADYIAKKYGVKTGMALWQAKQVCPDITFVSPRMDLYLRFSRMGHEIYAEYTDRQEPYGIDECWLDVTGSSSLKIERKIVMDKMNCLIEIGSIEKNFSDLINSKLAGFNDENRVITTQVINDAVDLIEDLVRDVYAFDMAFDNYNNGMSFMPQYYFENIVLHDDMIWERIIIIIAIAYQIDFEVIFDKRRIGYLYKIIKKDERINGDIKKIIQDINSDYDMKKLKFLRNGNEHYISTHLSDSPEKDKFKVDIKALIYIKDEIVYGDVQKINIQTDNMNREEMKILKNKVSIIQNKKSKYIELLSLCIEQMGIVFKNGDFYLNQKKHFLPEYSTPLCVEKDICSKCEILEVKYGELREELRSVIDMINKNVLVAMNFISYYDSEQLCNPCKQ
ncbi:DNA polymerase Y family protein [Butyribacter intestini]|nr:Cthe_2314 family HEPN domain-containing protein [Roseburia hominis]